MRRTPAAFVMIVDRPLPQFVRDILASVPHRGGGLDLWFYRVALKLHPYRTDDEIHSLLAALTEGEPVRPGEIERAIANSKAKAWAPGQPPRPAVKFSQWPAVNVQERAAIIHGLDAGLPELWEASPLRFEGSEANTEELIDRLFPGNPLLCCGLSNSNFDTSPRLAWCCRLSDLALIVPSPMSARSGLTRDGKESTHCLSNTGPRRFLVVEFDSGDVDDHAALLLHLAGSGPLALVVHSGSKFLHGWFHCAGQPEEQLRQFNVLRGQPGRGSGHLDPEPIRPHAGRHARGRPAPGRLLLQPGGA